MRYEDLATTASALPLRQRDLFRISSLAMAAQFRPTVAEISLDNLQHNCRLLRGLLPAAGFFCPMIKANAYGHGDIEAAQSLEKIGVTDLGVALLEEGRRLRVAGIEKANIIVFHPTLDVEAVREMAQYRLTPVVSSLASLSAVVAAGYSGSVHLKFNTGMNRLGFDENEFEELERFLQRRKFHVAGLCTHLHSAEDLLTRDSSAMAQLNKIKSIANRFGFSNNEIHALNSAGICGVHRGGLSAYGEFGARPGVSLYGVQPDLDGVISSEASLGLRPVMQVKSKIIQAHRIRRGEIVSYSGRYVAKADTIIGVVPIGYADGYSRQFSGRGCMLVNGQRRPVAGTVCMDFTMLDLGPGDEERAWLEREVVILGEQGGQQLSASDLAQQIQTNAYEILTNFSARVPRMYV